MPARLRRLPRQDWAWIDRRFIREMLWPLSGEAILLYFFLTCAGDKHGLSFYGDPTLAQRLQLPPSAIREARNQLIANDLLAYDPPLTQVLSLPPAPARGGDPKKLGDLLGALPKEQTPWT
jgi:hypothetical protein